MTVLMLLEHPFPPDIRVEKEGRVLREAGYEVMLLCPAREGEPEEEVVGGIKVFRFDGLSPLHPLYLLITSHWLLTFRHSLWLKVLLNFLKANHVDVIHVHDLPLVATAVAAKRRMGIPVVADLHENFPATLRTRGEGLKVLWKRQILKMILKNPRRWAKHEMEILQKVDHIFVIVEEAKERLSSLGIPPQKITVVPNAESPEFWKGVEVDREVVRRYEGKFVVSYIGGFGLHRGLDCAVRAMRWVTAEAPQIKLLLVGRSGWYGDFLERMARRNRVDHAIDFVPKVPLEKVRSYIEVTDVGLVPYHSNPNTEASAPHKLFQYMLFGKPVVVSSCRSLRRIVEETGAGLVFETGNPRDLARKILALYRSSELRRRLGENGRKAATEGKYSWACSMEALLNSYRRLLSKRTNKGI